MSDVNVLLCAVDSAMNTLAAFDRDRADVTARVSFALSTIQTKTGASPWFETVMLPGSGESAMRFSFFR